MRHDCESSSCATVARPHSDGRRQLNIRHRARTVERPGRSLGLAAWLDDPEQTIACGELMLIPNSNVRWLSIQAVPVRRRGSRRAVQRVAVTRARLQFGMPTLCFAERPGTPADVMRTPISDRSVRAVADRLIATVERAAEGADRRDPSIACWFPQVYLGFPAGSADDLFRLATRQQAIGRTLPCRGCGRDIELGRLCPAEVRSSDLDPCPVCGRVQRWPVGDAVPTRFTRHVPVGFIRRFCRAIEDRLPLRATGPTTYCGSRPFWPARDWPNLPDARSRRLDLVAHEFRCALSGEQRFVYLPRSTAIEARPGQSLDARAVWCRVLAAAPDAAWRSLPRPLQYTSADAVLGGDVWADHLKRVWFDHLGITCEELGEHQRLWPADLVAFAAGGLLRPLGLYWDFAPARQYVDRQLAATVFPPLRLGPHHPLRLTLPGEVAVDASSADPRHGHAGRGAIGCRALDVPPRAAVPLRLAS